MSEAPERDDDLLSRVQRGWAELRANRPLAAWAAWREVLTIAPNHQAARVALDLLENAVDLPKVARSSKKFRPPIGPARRERWNRALEGRDLSRLETAENHFADLADADQTDSAARFNQALCLAWLGRNLDAIERLDSAVAIDAPERFELAVDAWALAEVLRFGVGAEESADDLDCAVEVPWDEAIVGDPTQLDDLGLIRPLPNPAVELDELLPRARVFERLDRPFPAPSSELAAGELPRAIATYVLLDGRLRASKPGGITTEPPRVREDLDADAEPIRTPLPPRLLDAAAWTIRLPRGLDPDTRSRLTREHIEFYYENEWIHVPRRGLAGSGLAWRTPFEAALAARSGDVAAKAKLAGVILVREQLGSRPGTAELYAGYPFDRLRRRLGLEPRDPSLIDAEDVSSMNLDELAALEPESLDPSVLVDAQRSALGLRLDSLAERFAALKNA